MYRAGVLARALLALLFTAPLLSVSLVALPAAPASAGICTGPVCGEVWNNTSLWFMIGGGTSGDEKGWCWGDSTPRYGNSFSCQTTKTLAAHTESDNGTFKDTDSIRFDSGCKFKYHNNSALVNAWGVQWPYPYETRVDDRRGKANSKWIKVWDTDAIEVDHQSCSVSSPTKYWVDTFATATGYQDQRCWGDGGSGDKARCNPDGVLYGGTNYVFCKIRGDSYQVNGAYNYYWLLTDLDVVNSGRDGRSFVSAYFLSRWGNNVAKDNSGNVIPDC